eukprot:2188296-Prymnesium_polylepis.1
MPVYMPHAIHAVMCRYMPNTDLITRAPAATRAQTHTRGAPRARRARGVRPPTRAARHPRRHAKKRKATGGATLESPRS